MYRRYTPSPPPAKPPLPPRNGYQIPQQNQRSQGNHPRQNPPRQHRPNNGALPPVTVRERQEHSEKKREAKNPRSMLLGMLPPSLYNQKNKKILGFLSAEDLLLAALIFLFLEQEDEDQTIILVLLYLLLSDHIDLPFDF